MSNKTRIRADTGFSLKDDLFNATTVAELGSAMAGANPGFPEKSFSKAALAKFPELELKERIDWLVTCLEPHLPGDFGAALEVLRAALPEPLDPGRTDDDFGRFIWVVPGEWVARHGCTVERAASALAFLREATMRFSSESALRPFLKTFPDETLAAVREWTLDDNYHVRRLASEGIRPFLPWAARAPLPPAEIIDVLDRLHADRTRYVTRSVANTLNDLTKIEPAIVLDALQRWQSEGRQAEPELKWMTRHALRTLLKQDAPEVLALLGYAGRPRFELEAPDVTEVVHVGESFEWRSRLTSLADQRLKITLHIHFLKANGKHAAKVFAVRDAAFRRGESIEIVKRQPFRPITTRVLYPGHHMAELVVNGVRAARVDFELRVR